MREPKTRTPRRRVVACTVYREARIITTKLECGHGLWFRRFEGQIGRVITATCPECREEQPE